MNQPLWTNLRAVKSTSQPYTWFIEGIWNHEGNPEDPESWGWIADVNEAAPVRGSLEGDTAKALAHRYNSHDDLVAALADLLAWADNHQSAEGKYDGPCQCCITRRNARAALSRAMGEVAP